MIQAREPGEKLIKWKSHQPRLRVVAWVVQKARKSGPSGFISRTRIGAANSHGGDRQDDAPDRRENRVGAGGVHPVDFIRAEKQGARQAKLYVPSMITISRVLLLWAPDREVFFHQERFWANQLFIMGGSTIIFAPQGVIADGVPELSEP